LENAEKTATNHPGKNPPKGGKTAELDLQFGVGIRFKKEGGVYG